MFSEIERSRSVSLNGPPAQSSSSFAFPEQNPFFSFQSENTAHRIFENFIYGDFYRKVETGHSF